jgi:CelD/BcsL family acetyltransferase involved in cellulose biosynthesis
MKTGNVQPLSESVRAVRERDTTEALTWQPRRLPMPFRMGEWRLFAPAFKGVSAQPSPWTTAPLSDPAPPREVMREHGVRAAFMYSCPVAAPLPVLSMRDGWLRYTASQYPHYYVDVSGDFEDYLERFRGRTLSTVRRKIRRAAASNTRRPLTQRYDTPAAFEEFFELALPISRQSYQQRLFGEGLPETPAFREEVATRAARGQIRGFIAFVEDRPAAYTLCPGTEPGVVLYDQTGYDPALEQWSPGTVLQFAVIEALFAEPDIRIYDLCTGGGRHKELFASGHRHCANIWFLRPASAAAASALAHRALASATAGIKAGLGRLELRDRIKKWMRRV